MKMLKDNEITRHCPYDEANKIFNNAKKKKYINIATINWLSFHKDHNYASPL